MNVVTQTQTPIDITALLRELGRGANTSRPLTRAQAQALFAAMLAGEIDDLRLGALLIAYRIKGETAEELAGMLEAAHATLAPVPIPENATHAPVVIASYNGARRLPNLTPLLALSLAKRGVPVLVHGEPTDPHGRVGSASIFAELSIEAAASPRAAADALNERNVAWMPITRLSPPLARMLALRERVGLRNSAHTIVKLLNPFAGAALRLVNFTHPPYRDALFELFTTVAASAAPGVLLARGTEGEAVADARRQVAVEWLANGEASTVIEAVRSDDTDPVPLPPLDAAATARWTEQALNGEVPIPASIQQQIDCIVALCAAPTQSLTPSEHRL